MRRLVLVVLLAGCDVVDLPLVDVDAGDAFMPMMGAPCSNNDGCLGGQFCEKPACGALGRCVAQPPFCDGESRPECGCDGVTYWNDCLRRQAGQSMRERGPCVSPRPCDTTTPCGGEAICARIVDPSQCVGVVPAGACFVLPANSCEGFMPDHFYECGSTMTQCLDACGAIRSGRIVARYRGPCP
jgi:hypothetical protein